MWEIYEFFISILKNLLLKDFEDCFTEIIAYIDIFNIFFIIKYKLFSYEYLQFFEVLHRQKSLLFNNE